MWANRPLAATKQAADRSGGKYNLHVDSASKSNVLDAMKDAKKGDIVTFYGHALISKSSGKAVGLEGTGWVFNSEISASEIQSALGKDSRPPSVVILSACQTVDLLPSVRAAGVPVAIGLTAPLSDALAGDVANQVTAGLMSGKTINEAIEAGRELLNTSFNVNLADIEVRASDDVDLDKSLKENGLQ